MVFDQRASGLALSSLVLHTYRADPVDPDTIWVLNVPLMKSVDGGTNWTKVDTPSDHHDQWINPHNNQNMISANDGGHDYL